MQYWGTGRLSTHQSVAFTGTAGTITNGVGTGVLKVRVYVTSAAYIYIGARAATTGDVPMAAGVPEYFTISPGEKVSAIQVSAGGDLHVTEIT